jgi:small subunit ribosomal protein S20
MPVTNTAKRALRGSKRKEILNKLTFTELDIAIRTAKKTKTKESVRKAISLTDRTSKKNIIHKNKAARIKSRLSKIASPKKKAASSKKTSKKTK